MTEHRPNERRLLALTAPQMHAGKKEKTGVRFCLDKRVSCQSLSVCLDVRWRCGVSEWLASAFMT